MSLFSKPPRRKKVADKSAASNGPQAGVQPTNPNTNEEKNNENNEDVEDVNTPAVDDDKQEYDDRVIKKLVKNALESMAAEGVIPTSEHLQDGRTLMPKASTVNKLLIYQPY